MPASRLRSFNERYWIIAGLLTVSCYVTLLLINVRNIPFADDIALLSSINEFQKSNGFFNQVKGIVDFHNEHRIAIPRIITLLLFYIQGETVNFISWILIGNSFTAGILYLIYRVCYSHIRFAYFLPVLLLLLQPMHYELMYWGMASIQNLGVILLAFLGIYLLLTNKQYGALLCTIAATFTSANGIFAFAACVGILLYRKQWSAALLWFAIALIGSIVYWYGFSPIYSAGQTVGERFSLSTFAVTFLSFVGGLFYLQKVPIIAVLTGILFGIILIRSSYFKLVKEQQNDTVFLFFLSCIFFVLFTIVAISIHRNAESISLVSRYKLYPELLTVLLYSMSLKYVMNWRYLFYFILITSFFFSIVSYLRFTPKFTQHDRLLLASFFNWKQSNRLDFATPLQQHYYSANWQASLQKKQYSIPESVQRSCQRILAQVRTNPAAAVSFTKDASRTYLTPVYLPPGAHYLVRKSNVSVMIYPMMPATPNLLILNNFPVAYTTAVPNNYWLADQQTTSQIVTLP